MSELSASNKAPNNSMGLKKLFSPKMLKGLLITCAAIAVFLLCLPLMLNEPFVRGLHEFNESSRWVFTGLRWGFYLAVLAYAPWLIERKRGSAMTPEDKKSLRWMFVRVFVLYDLIFAFDLFGWRA
jgi:hypothetical protein